MNYARIENGVVTSTISADDNFIKSLKDSDFYIAIEDPNVVAGYAYQNGVFFAPQKMVPIDSRTLEQVKADKIKEVKGDATDLILESWPDFAQRNAALGVYDSLPADDPYYPPTMRAYISKYIAIVRQSEIEISQLQDADSVNNYTVKWP